MVGIFYIFKMKLKNRKKNTRFGVSNRYAPFVGIAFAKKEGFVRSGATA